MMLEKLAEIEMKYSSLSDQINDPDIISDQNRWRKLMKEYSDMTPIMEKYREYRAAKESIVTDGGDALLNDHGPDLIPAVDPGKLAGSGPVQHLAGTGNGQHTVLRQSPDQVVAASSRSEDGHRKHGKQQT